VHLIKVVINLLLEVMIELVKYGTLTQDKSYLVLTSIVMLFTVWPSIILLVIKLLQVHLIKKPRSGMHNLANVYIL